MAYTPYYPDWKDDPDHTTPIVADALDNMEAGIGGAHDANAATQAELDALETQVDGIGQLAIPKLIMDAAGDLIVGSAPDIAIRVPKGTNGQVLTSQAAAPGVGWADPTGGGGGAPSGPAGGVLSGTYPDPAFAADMATQAELDAHVNDSSAAHSAGAISSIPFGGLAATNVQSALYELQGEIGGGGGGAPSGPAGGVLGGTYPDPTFAADMATQAELDAHLNDAVNAHTASAIQYLGGAGLAAIEVEAAIDELTTNKAQLINTVMDGDAAGGALDGTYPNPGLAASVAGAGLSETSNVLAVVVDGATIEIATDTLRVKDGGITAAKVAADVATQAELDAHAAAADPHTGYQKESEKGVANGYASLDSGVLVPLAQIPVITAAKVAADVATQAELDAHVNDTSAAHAASAIGFTPAGTIAATDVQAAIVEVAAEAGGGGAPTTADYLVGTAQAGLSAEIAVGTTPGGELGGTWAAPTVDASHSGSTHAAVQAAAEATAAGALSTHVAAADPHTGYQKESEKAAANGYASLDASTLVPVAQIPTITAAKVAADVATQAELDAHVNDTTAAHAASAIAFTNAGGIIAADVQSAIVQAAALPTPPEEWNYTEKTSSVNVTATVEASSDIIITAANIVANGTTVYLIECYLPAVIPSPAVANRFEFFLFDGSTSLGRIGLVSTPAAAEFIVPVYMARRLTPAALGHTFSVRAKTVTGTAVASMSATSPGFIRITSVAVRA